MVDQPKWEWIDAILGWILGTVTTVAAMLGWFSPKLSQMEREFDEKVTELHERVTPIASQLAALSAHHENDREMLRAINLKLESIEKFLRRDTKGRMP